jgi:ethanolamine transporter EutH
MGLASLPFKQMLIGYMWERLTPTLAFAICYASGSISILRFARFYLGTEFVTGFCLSGAVVLSCAGISALRRAYRDANGNQTKSVPC